MRYSIEVNLPMNQLRRGQNWCITGFLHYSVCIIAISTVPLGSTNGGWWISPAVGKHSSGTNGPNTMDLVICAPGTDTPGIVGLTARSPSSPSAHDVSHSPDDIELRVDTPPAQLWYTGHEVFVVEVYPLRLFSRYRAYIHYSFH